MISDIIERIRRLDKRTQLAILVGIGLVIVALVAWAIVDSAQKQDTVNRIVEESADFAPEPVDPLSAPLKQIFGGKDETKGLYLGNSDVEFLASDGDWLSVRVISRDMSNYGSQYYAIYLLVDGQYRAAVVGSIINRDDYSNLDIPEQYRIPSSIFDAIDRHTARRSDSRLQAILDNAPNKTYPIINSLPMSNDFYKITYSFEDQSDVDSFYLYVNALSGYNNAAINRLINAGFDPADYKIVFNYDLIKRLSE
jgi:hypothetical protein